MREISALFLFAAACSGPRDLGLAYSGGETTVFLESSLAFSTKASNLDVDKLADFTFGNRIFNTNWVTAPSSTRGFDGLGPFFNRVSCSGCHLLDGRGRPPEDKRESMDSMIIRVSVAGKSSVGGPKLHPTYGDQISSRAILGIVPEGHATIDYKEQKGIYPDGTSYSLRVPVIRLDLNYGPADLLISARVAPAVFGLGLLEAVSEEEILRIAGSQPPDIRGRPNYVYDVQAKRTALGRFGWKANVPTLRQQNAGAALGDIGLTSSVFPDQNVAETQTRAMSAPTGGSPELKDEFLADLTFYTRTLGVPARRGLMDRDALRGERMFAQIGCGGCHLPTMRTTNHPDGVREVSNQVIHPYTDLLLHDMGPALADGRPDFQASGSEWRTPPLWGIGLIPAVNHHSYLLHDGRARNLEEAIIWHGGQAAGAKGRFLDASADDRRALLAFLRSL